MDWKEVWRKGFVPQLSDKQLLALAQALRDDDARLVQGVTSFPPPVEECRSLAVERACAVGFCGWQGDELETVGEVEEFFGRTCLAAERLVEPVEPTVCRHFLNWFDDTPRNEMRRELLAEVESILQERRENARGQEVSGGTTD